MSFHPSCSRSLRLECYPLGKRPSALPEFDYRSPARAGERGCGGGQQAEVVAVGERLKIRLRRSLLPQTLKCDGGEPVTGGSQPGSRETMSLHFTPTKSLAALLNSLRERHFLAGASGFILEGNP